MRHAATLCLLVTVESISPRIAAADEVWQSVPAEGQPVQVSLGPIQVQVPPGARWTTTDGQYKLLVHLSAFSEGTVHLADREPPASQQAAVVEWTRWDGTLLGAGTTEGGAYWAVVTHEVRAPIEGDPKGRHGHFLKTITLVHGVIETPGGRAECKVHLEREAAGMHDRGVTQALTICESMAPTAERGGSEGAASGAPGRE